MSEKAKLYDDAYANYELEIYRQIRIETYGEDLGQTSWVTTGEANEIPASLELTAKSLVLEIGCGSGKYALRVATQTGCSLVGIDINSHGIHNANRLATNAGLNSRVDFEEFDAAQKLSFKDCSFDGAFSNDALCHVPGRAAAVAEIHRVLKPDGCFFFSDALIVGGMLSFEEIATRSSIGYYIFSPPGENEKLIVAAGFRIISVKDTTIAAAQISKRWHDARIRRKEELIALEGQAAFDTTQRFLQCVHRLTSEKRLLRYTYLARKEA
jgi:SAM-dependent methyltransferase